MCTITIRALTVVALVTVLSGAGAAVQHAASIPFADIGNIRNWHSDSSDELYIEAMNEKWYRATFWAPCHALPFAAAIAFVTEPNGALDSYSSVLVDGERCWFKSFEAAPQPPRERRERGAAR